MPQWMDLGLPWVLTLWLGCTMRSLPAPQEWLGQPPPTCGEMVTLNMGMYWRMKNSMSQLDVEARIAVLIKFIVKMKASVYFSRTIGGVMRSGLRYYYRQLRIDQEGGPGMNQKVTDNQVARLHAKMLASSSWFVKRKRGGQKEAERKDNSWRIWSKPTRSHNMPPNSCSVPTTHCATSLGHNQGTSQSQDLTKEMETVLLVLYTVGGK